MVPCYCETTFGTYWVWAHGNECRGKYYPKPIAALIRPVSNVVKRLFSIKPTPKLRVMRKRRRFAISQICRMLKMLRRSK